MSRSSPCLFLVLVPGLAGCLMTPQQPVVNAYSRSHAGPTPVRVLNASSRQICYVQLAPAGAADWGDDWLGTSETIPTGTMRQLGVAPGSYNVRLDDCQHAPVQMQMGLDLSGPREIVVHDGAPPAIPATLGFARLELVAMRALPPPVVAGDAGGGWSESVGGPEPTSFGAGHSAAVPAAPSGPAHYSLTLHNSCPRTVGLYHGTGSGRPPFASGTYGSIGSNTTESFSGFAPENFWIVDDSRNGISSFTATGGSQRVEITSSCSGFAAD